ncbi:MAG: ATP-binding protein [Candidatus Aenigmarchaeota archaeon]|nr:ATP-binding protein [Candidatus Aenigmarchaeota archaeon]
MQNSLKKVLVEWEKRGTPKDIIERDITLKKYLPAKPRKIITISGFRRTGKTYLFYSLLNKLGKGTYINFEDERIDLRKETLSELLPTIRELFGEEKYIFLDEIQNMPEWSKFVRRIYDSENIYLFLTGSSSKLSSKEIATELRGRCINIEVFPLNFSEFLRFKNIEINLSNLEYNDLEKAKTKRLLSEYLKYGGLPEVVLSDKFKKSLIVQDYFRTVVDRDIIERYGIRDTGLLLSLLKLLLNSTKYSISKLYKTLKTLGYQIGKNTISNYLDYIHTSYFLYSVPIFSPKIKDQMQYPRKCYFVDNSFITFLSTKFVDNSGRLLENLVFMELRKKQGINPMLEIYYWKNSNAEIDFVLKDGLKVKQLIQVCYSMEDEETRKREIRGLLKASKELKCKDLLIISFDEEADIKQEGKTIKIVPLWKWLLL